MAADIQEVRLTCLYRQHFLNAVWCGCLKILTLRIPRCLRRGWRAKQQAEPTLFFPRLLPAVSLISPYVSQIIDPAPFTSRPMNSRRRRHWFIEKGTGAMIRRGADISG